MMTIPHSLSTTLELIIRDTKNTDIESTINMEVAGISDWLKNKYMIFHTTPKSNPITNKNR